MVSGLRRPARTAVGAFINADHVAISPISGGPVATDMAGVASDDPTADARATKTRLDLVEWLCCAVVSSSFLLGQTTFYAPWKETTHGQSQ